MPRRANIRKRLVSLVCCRLDTSVVLAVISQPTSVLVPAEFATLVAPLKLKVFFTCIIPDVLRRVHSDVASYVFLHLDSILALIPIVPILTIGSSIEMPVSLPLLVHGHFDWVLVGSES